VSGKHSTFLFTRLPVPPTTSDQASTGETGEYQRTSALHYDYNIIRDENDFGAEFIAAPIENPIYDLLQQIQEENRSNFLVILHHLNFTKL